MILQTDDTSTTLIYWIVFVGYLIFLAVMGIRAKGKTHNFEDFMNAGRSLGPLLLGISFGVTYFSAVMIVGGGEYSFIWGLSSIWIAVIDCAVGVFAMFLFFGKRTMKMSEEFGTITTAELLGKRYQSKAMQQTTAAVTLIFETVYLVSIYMGLSILLKYVMPNVDPNISYTIAVVLCGTITIIYLNIGGAHGAISTDIVESIIMLAGVAVVFIVGLQAVGGLENLITTLEEIATAPKANGGAGLSDPNGLTTSLPTASPMGFIGYILVTSFGVWGMPQMITRYFTVNKNKSIRGGLLIAVLWSLIVALLAWWNGAIGRAYYWQQNPFTKISFTFDEIVPALITDLLPPFFVALFIAAVAAASLTTGEKIILVASSSFSRDFYQLRTKCSDEKAMSMTKITNIIVVVIAVVLAIQKPDAVLALCMFAWAALAAMILVPYVFGLFWKGGTAKAAVISGLLACIVAILWKVVFRGFCSPATGCWKGDIFPLIPVADARNLTLFTWNGVAQKLSDVHEFIVSQVVALVAFPIISLLTKKDINKEFVNKLFDVITEKAPSGATVEFQK